MLGNAAKGASKPVAARGGVAKPKLDAGKKAAKSKGSSETQAPAANKPGSIQIMVRGKPITVDLSSAYKRPTPEEEERRKRRNREREERRKRQRDHVKQLVSNMNRGIPTFDPLLGRGAKKVARGRKAGGTMGMGSWPDYDDFHISDEKAEKWERMLEEETAEEDPSLAAREEQ